MRRALTLASLVLIPAVAKGGELHTLLEKALKTSPKVEAVKRELSAAGYEVKEAYSNYLPKVEATYTYTDLSDVPSYTMELPGIPLPPTEFQLLKKKFYRWEVSAQLPLFTGGRVYSLVKVKKAKREALKEELTEVEERVLSQVAQDYYEVLKAKGLIKAARGALKAAKEHYRVVKAFFDEGIVPRRDLLEAQVKVSQAEEALKKAEGYYRVALEKLRADVGDYSFEPKEELREELPRLKERPEELVSEALAKRALLKELRELLRGAEAGEGLAKSQFAPKAGVELAYHRTDEYPMNGNFGYKRASLFISFPIFEGSKRFWEVKRAREERLKVEAKLEEARRLVRLQVISAYQKLKTAKARVEAAKRRVREAEELLRSSKERYREHVGTSTEVVDAIAYLLEAESSLTSAVADYYKALWELRYATGRVKRELLK